MQAARRKSCAGRAAPSLSSGHATDAPCCCALHTRSRSLWHVLIRSMTRGAVREDDFYVRLMTNLRRAYPTFLLVGGRVEAKPRGVRAPDATLGHARFGVRSWSAVVCNKMPFVVRSSKFRHVFGCHPHRALPPPQSRLLRADRSVSRRSEGLHASCVTQSDT